LEPDSLLSDGSVVAFIDLKEVSLDELNDFTIKEVIGKLSIFQQTPKI
jgi:hypothetical protein